MNYLFHILLAINCVLIVSGRLFFRGRPANEYGMVGLPVQDTDVIYNSMKNLPRDQWFEQNLNHFNPVDNRTWKQRYFINDTFHTRGGPVFLFLYGESVANPLWVIEGQMAKNYAKRFNAMSVMLEHRYYGESHPIPDLSTENLQYLSSEQALQDTAHFIEYLTDKLSLNSSKWIVFGGSYGGLLAAWFRLKYPHLVAGAVASSAPVEAVVDFKQYSSVVDKSLGQSCADAVREANIQLAKELKNKKDWNEIQKQFNLCQPMNASNLNDVYNFFKTMAVEISVAVQQDFEIGDTIIDPIGHLCNVMTNTSLSPLERYIKYFRRNMCLDVNYNKLITKRSKTDWNSSMAVIGDRQWTYQTCTEFGYFQTSDPKDQSFGTIPLQYYIDRCTDIFGPAFNGQLVRKSVEFTNNFYGGSKLNVRKVVFPNGSLDPWHVLGILKDLNSDSPAILINGTSHCADMYSDSDSDSEALIAARSRIIQALHRFLNES